MIENPIGQMNEQIHRALSPRYQTAPMQPEADSMPQEPTETLMQQVKGNRTGKAIVHFCTDMAVILLGGNPRTVK